MSSTDEAKEKEKSIFFWRNWGRKCDRVRKELYECVIVTDCCQKVGMHFEDKHADNFFIFRRYHSYMIMNQDGYSAISVFKDECCMHASFFFRFIRTVQTKMLIFISHYNRVVHYCRKGKHLKSA